MKKHTHCLHCKQPLDSEHRAVKCYVVGSGNRFLYGRACKSCWNGRLLGSLIYSADVCHQEPCRCGWCAEWKQLQAERAAKKAAQKTEVAEAAVLPLPQVHEGRVYYD